MQGAMSLIALQFFYADSRWSYEFTLTNGSGRLVDETGTAASFWEAVRLVVEKLWELKVIL